MLDTKAYQRKHCVAVEAKHFFLTLTLQNLMLEMFLIHFQWDKDG